MGKKRALMLSALVRPCVFILVLFVRVRVVDPYLPLLVGLQNYYLLSAPLLAVGLVAAITFLLVYNFYRLLRGSIPVLFARCEVIAYFLVLFWIIMFKSVGIRRVNLNPLNIIDQFLSDPTTLLLNILLFIPVGLLFKRFFSNAPLAFAIVLVLVLLMEFAQWLFALGIFDVVDIITNLLGFALGYLMAARLGARGIGVRKEGKVYLIGRVRSSQEGVNSGTEITEKQESAIE